MPKKPKLSVDLSQVTQLKEALAQFNPALDKESIDEIRTDLVFYRIEMQDRSSVGPLIERSGALKNSWYVEIQGDALQNLQGALFVYKPYSLIHEKGGTTYPKSARWLYIPIGYNRKADGKPIYSPTEATTLISQRVFSYGIFNDPDDGKDKFGIRDDKGIGIYVLAKSATYKAQLGTVALSPKYEDLITKKLGKRAVDIINEKMDLFGIAKG